MAEWDIQTSKCGSLHLYGPTMDFSGGLDLPISFSHFRKTDEMMMGSCWFFDQGRARAHAAVQAEIPCPVWECDTEAP